MTDKKGDVFDKAVKKSSKALIVKGSTIGGGTTGAGVGTGAAYVVGGSAAAASGFALGAAGGVALGAYGGYKLADRVLD